MFQRVTVEEFNHASEEFPGQVVTKCWFEPEFLGTERRAQRVCAACALTVVGLLRKYYTFDDLARDYERVGRAGGVAYKSWNEKTSHAYVDGFVDSFDEYDSERADEPLVEPEDENDHDTGYYDGALCRVALDTAKVSSGGIE